MILVVNLGRGISSSGIILIAVSLLSTSVFGRSVLTPLQLETLFGDKIYLDLV